ncbi:unnamed protein product [Closterium sp. Naga37s-1]|nr:unnamed protein product [Closterium sp. Naga37s-1]
MEPALLSAISAIHAAPARAVLAVTGGASQAVGWLVAVPGASQTVLEAVLPYSQRAFDQYVDATWHAQAQVQYVSRAAAQHLAFASYNRALSLAPIAQPVVGVGCTCALVSSAPKRGAHRCHIAARSQGMLWEYSLLLSKEALRSRQQEDDMASRLLIREVLEERVAVGVYDSYMPSVLQVACAVSAAPTWASRWGAAGEGRRVVLCGSFNPLHQGHTDLMAAALLEVRGGVPCYEMAAWNADKGAIPVDEVERRVHQFTAHGHMVVITRLPLFASKASLFPHSTFVIGYDTAVRLLDVSSSLVLVVQRFLTGHPAPSSLPSAPHQPKYYGNSHSSMMDVLHAIAHTGSDFLVAGRLVGATFQVRLSSPPPMCCTGLPTPAVTPSLPAGSSVPPSRPSLSSLPTLPPPLPQSSDSLVVPESLRAMFRGIPEASFRADISSTEIRAQLAAQQAAAAAAAAAAGADAGAS